MSLNFFCAVLYSIAELWKRVEIHQSMALYSTHHSLAVHQLGTRAEWLDTWPASVPLLRVLIVIQVSCRICLHTYDDTLLWDSWLLFLFGFQSWIHPFLDRSCVNKLRRDYTSMTMVLHHLVRTLMWWKLPWKGITNVASEDGDGKANIFPP
jgi:hypothetical protein